MRKLKRQIWYDIQAGTLSIWYDYLIYAAVLLFITKSMYRGMTWFDSLSGYFRGIAESSAMESASIFRIPIEWFFFHMGYLFFVVRYPFRDYAERGYPFLLRSGSKAIWWLSKYLWTVGTAIGYCLIFYTVPFLWSRIIERERFWQQTDRWGVGLGECSRNEIIGLLFLMPVLVSAALSTVLLLVSFLWNQAGAVISMLTILVASAYWKHPFLIGNYTMLCRYSIAEGRLKGQILYGCIICAGLMLLSGMVGYISFCKREFIKREG